MSEIIGIPILIVVLLLLVVVFAVSIFMLTLWYKSRENFEKAYKNAKDLVFFKVQVPEDNEVEIKAFEQFYTNLLGIKETGRFNKNKSPNISLEIVGDYTGINFYIVTPKSIESLVEKAIHAVYNDADVYKGKQNIYNIWDKGGVQEFKEMYLSKEDYYPIKTYEELEHDTLNSITSSMSKMAKGEALALQILIRPAAGYWKDVGNTNANALLNKKDKEGNPKTSDKDREKAESIKSKTKYEGFEFVLRLMSVAPEKELAKSNLKNLQNAINTLNNPQGNKFGGKDIKEVPFLVPGKKQFLFAFVYRVFPFLNIYIPYVKTRLFKGYSVLNTKELATLFHLPNKNVKTPGINWLRSRSNIAPANLPESGLYLGKSVFRGTQKKIFMNTDDRRRHMYVVGQTGTGKSELLKYLAVQDIKDGKGVAFMDPHGSAVRDIIQMVPKERIKDVIYFNPGDEEYPMGLNLLDVKTSRAQDLVINSFIELLYKLYDPNRQGIVGPQLERAVRNSMLTVMQAVPGGTLVEVLRLVIDQDYQKELTQKVTDPVVKRYWTDEMANTQAFHRSEKTGYFVSKFDRFVTEKVMRNIIGQSKSAFDLGDVMKNKKILLIDLNKGTLGEENSKFLGLLLVPRILGAAFQRANSGGEYDDFYFYVDEFQNFATPDFVTILSEARKYKLNLTVANQFLAQMDEDIKNAIFGNVGTLVSFRVGQDDGKYMSEQFAPTFSENDLINLKVGTTAIRLLVDGHPTPPFTMVTDWPAMQQVERSGEVAQQIITESRQKYGKTVAEVEAEMEERSDLSGKKKAEEAKKKAAGFGGSGGFGSNFARSGGGFSPMPSRYPAPPKNTFAAQRPAVGTQTTPPKGPAPFTSGRTPFSSRNNQSPPKPYPNSYLNPNMRGQTPMPQGFRPQVPANRGIASNLRSYPKIPNIPRPGFEKQDSSQFINYRNTSGNQQVGVDNKGDLGGHKRGVISLADIENSGDKKREYKQPDNTFKNAPLKPPLRQTNSGPVKREGEENLPKPPSSKPKKDDKTI